MVNFMDINGKDISVKQFRNDWALALMKKGVIVKLNIGSWRGTAQLKPEDLGLKFVNSDSAAFMKKYITLGSEKLLPPQVLQEIICLENRARENLYGHSFSTIWGNFIPYVAFDSWDKENKIIYADFFKAAQRLGDRYEEIISIVRNDYRKMAEDVWQRLYPTSTNGATESFIDNFVENVVSKIPSKTDIISSFRYNTTYFIIPLPTFIENNIAKAKDIQRESENKDFENELEKQTKEKIAKEYISKKVELIDGFLESTVEEMREQITKLCDNILQSIGQSAKNQEISKKQLNSVKNMIKRVRLLNFYDDKKIDKLLSELDFEIMKAKGVRNKDTIVQKLRQITEAESAEFVPEDFSPTIGYLEV